MGFRLRNRKDFIYEKKKKKQDLKPDTILKNYWSNNEQFADLFNVVLFDGKPSIHPKEIAETLKASRNIIKIRKKLTVVGVELVLLRLENQDLFNLLEILLDTTY